MIAQSSRKALRIGLVIIVLIVIGAAVFFLPMSHFFLSFLEWIQGLGAWGPIFVALFYIVACVFLLPGSVLTLGAGFLFGVPIGLLSAWIGATAGACVAFLVGRNLARDWVAAKIAANPKFAAMDEVVAREGFKIVLLLRLSPIFPFNFLNYALGLTKVSFGEYALASLIGMLPGGLMYVYFGSAARSLAEVATGKVETGWAGQAFFWIGLAATVIVAGFVTRLARKSLKESENRVRTEKTEADSQID